MNEENKDAPLDILVSILGCKQCGQGKLTPFYVTSKGFVCAVCIGATSMSEMLSSLEEASEQLSRANKMMKQGLTFNEAMRVSTGDYDA
jgi:hypothetical protein